MDVLAPTGLAKALRWLSTLIYVPALYLSGFLLSRPLGWLMPTWRTDQVDLAGATMAFALLLVTLPIRLRRVWGENHPWRRLGLRVPVTQAIRTGLAGLALSFGLLAFVSAGLLLSGQALWAGNLADPGRLANALLLGSGVALAEEVVFRGWLWGELKLLVSRRQALLGQAVVFAIVHPWYRASGLLAISLLAGLMLLGIGLAIERRRGKGSLWGACALHGGLVGGWFLMQSGLLVVSPLAPGWWVGPGGTSSNPVGGLLGLIGLTLLVGLRRREAKHARGQDGSNKQKRIHRANVRKRRIRLVMMQKDEGELLHSWVKYHADIVGYANLCIIDHGSTCPRTKLFLDQAFDNGALVVRQRYQHNDYSLKGAIIETEIKRYPAHAYIPMDCDEFLCLERAGSITCNPKKILLYLQQLPQGKVYKVKRRLNNAPWSASTFLPMSTTRPGKIFMTTKHFHGLDMGNHRCMSTGKAERSRISYIHLHNRPFDWLVRASRAKLLARGLNTKDREALMAYRQARRPGWHLCENLLISEDDWIAHLRKHDQFISNAFSRRLQKLGLDHPFFTRMHVQATTEGIST